MPTKKKDEGVKAKEAVKKAAPKSAPKTETPVKKPCKFLCGKLADGKYRILKSSVVEDGSVVRFKTEHGNGYTLPRAEYDAL
jgi:hypothetical protein